MHQYSLMQRSFCAGGTFVVLLTFEETESMKRVAIEKIMTEQEYIDFELSSELRHEYINGKLLEMPGESTAYNDLAGNLYLILSRH